MKKFLVCLGAAVVAAWSLFAGEAKVRSGDTVVFLGDSITHYGTCHKYGYVRLTVAGLEANGIKTTWFGAGVPGNKACNMNKRFQKDVLDRKPTVLTISAGVNDVWFMREDSVYERYLAEMEDMVGKAKAAGVREIFLLTPTTAYGEKEHKHIAKYAAGAIELARKLGVGLADMHEAVRSLIDDPASPVLSGARGLKATVDGVHMAPEGDRVMARCLLKAFGLDAEQLAKAEKAWLESPVVTVKSAVRAPLAAYRRLEAEADAGGAKIERIYGECFRRGLEAEIAAPVPETKRESGYRGPCEDLGLIGDYFEFVEKSNPSGLARLLGAVPYDDRGSTMSLTSQYARVRAKGGDRIRRMLVSTGSYDAWNKGRERYPSVVSGLVARAKADGVKIVFLTTRPVRANGSDGFNRFLMSLDDGDGVRTLDRHAIILAELARRKANPKAACTAAGYPLNASVNYLTAKALLPLVGVDGERAAKLVAEWERMEDFAVIEAETEITFAQREALVAIAKKENRPLDRVLATSLDRSIASPNCAR